jgi:hypothetical protein
MRILACDSPGGRRGTPGLLNRSTLTGFNSLSDYERRTECWTNEDEFTQTNRQERVWCA